MTQIQRACGNAILRRKGLQLRGFRVGFLCFSMIVAMSGAAAIGSSLYREGQREMKARNYSEAVRLLSLALEEKPSDCEVRRDLGVALFKSGRYQDAESHLRSAADCLPGDGPSLYYLGSTYEQLDDLDKAISVFQRSSEVRRFTKYRGYMEERRKQLVRKQITLWAEERKKNEHSLSTDSIADNTIALSPLDATNAQEIWAPLGLAMAEWLTTDLAKLRSLSVVERLRLNAILDELSLPGIDPETAPRAGRLVGAYRVVTGGLYGTGKDALRIDLGVTETTGKTLTGISAAGNVNAFFSIEKDLVFSLINRLGIDVKPLERAEIQQIPTRNLGAMLAYGRGLMAERDGRLSEARAAYEEALSQDRGFGLASDALDNVPTEEAEITEPPGPWEDGVGEDVTQDRLEDTDRLIGSGLWPLDPNDLTPLPTTDQIPEPPGPPDVPPPTIPDPPPPPEIGPVVPVPPDPPPEPPTVPTPPPVPSGM